MGILPDKGLRWSLTGGGEEGRAGGKKGLEGEV